MEKGIVPSSIYVQGELFDYNKISNMEKEIELRFEKGQNSLFGGNVVDYYKIVKEGTLDHDLSPNPEDPETRAYIEGLERDKANHEYGRYIFNVDDKQTGGDKMYEEKSINHLSKDDVLYVSDLAKMIMPKFYEETHVGRICRAEYISLVKKMETYIINNKLSKDNIRLYIGEKVPKKTYKKGYYYYFLNRLRKHLEDLIKNDDRFEVVEKEINTINEYGR